MAEPEKQEDLEYKLGLDRVLEERQEIAASDFLEPRTTDQSNLPDVISDPSKDPNKSPKSKGSLFRGIGKLAQSRIFPLIQMAQGAYGALSEEQKSEISNFLDKPAYELVGMEKPGLEYFKDLLLGEKPSTEVSETPAENLMKTRPVAELKLDDVFKSDIPRESWLKEKVDYVKSQGKDDMGFNFIGADTGNFKNNFIPRIAVSELVKLKGRNREQENVREDDLAYLKEYMGRTGKLPLTEGKEYRPFITVDYEGVPTVSEGNHRIMAAAALGMKDLPVEIRYFDGGERKATGVFKPENLIKNSKAAFVDPKSEAKAEVPAEVPAEKLMKTRPVIKEPEVFFKGDLGKLQAADSPDGMKAILFDDEDYGKELLGELRTGDTLNPASLKQLNTLKKKVYDQTQESIAELPDVLSVYRIGKLGRNEASEPVSFSLTPNIPLSGLPWYKDKGLSIQEYKVNKSDILAAPNAIFRKGKGSADEQEVIIRGTDVTLKK